MNKPLSLRPRHKGRKHPQRQIPGRPVMPKGYCRSTGGLGQAQGCFKTCWGLKQPQVPSSPCFPVWAGCYRAVGNPWPDPQSQRHWSSSRKSHVLSQAWRFMHVGSIILNTNHQGCTWAASKVPADGKRCSVTCKGRQQLASPRLGIPPSILSLIAQALDLNQQFGLGYRP